MKRLNKKHLELLEDSLRINSRQKCAQILCDSESLPTFDISQVNANRVLILPDNGHRVLGSKRFLL